jgi:DNA or RNA helicases of superfamily II
LATAVHQVIKDSPLIVSVTGALPLLLYHATGTGKTVTAVSDAKRLGRRTLFLAHTKELITQAQQTFNTLWDKTRT